MSLGGPGGKSPDEVVCLGIAGTNAEDLGTVVQDDFREGPGPF